MLKLFLERLLVGPAGLHTVGLPLPIAGSHRMLFGMLSSLLSDGDGHRMGLDWKGASSMKPCFKRVNVFMKDRLRPARITCHWVSDLSLWQQRFFRSSSVCSLVVLARRLRSTGQQLGTHAAWLR